MPEDVQVQRGWMSCCGTSMQGKNWVDVNVGTWAFEQAIELDKCSGTFEHKMSC